MKHPEILLLPFLILSDYLLTLIAVRLKDKKYAQHFKCEALGMHQAYEQVIEQRKWFTSRIFLGKILISVSAIILSEYLPPHQTFVDVFFGAMFVNYALSVGLQLFNIMVYRYVNRRPDEISGQVSIGHAYLLHVSMYLYFVVTIPLAIVAILDPRPFVFGGLASVLLQQAYHLWWIRRYRRKRGATNLSARAKQGVRLRTSPTCSFTSPTVTNSVTDHTKLKVRQPFHVEA